jgi:hypothetical protein
MVQGLGPLFFAFFFQQHSPGKYDIASFTVVFQDLEIEFLADHFIQVANGSKIRLGSGKECLNTDIHRETAFNTVGDGSCDGVISFVTILDIVPDLDLLGFFLGQNDHFVLIVPPFHHHFDGVTDLRGNFTVHLEFPDANLAFRFVPDIHQDVVFVHRDDLSVYHLTFGKTFEALFVQIHELRHAFTGNTVFLDRFFG